MKQIWETRVSDTGDGKNEIAISLGDASVTLDAIQLLEFVEQLVADRAKMKPAIPYVQPKFGERMTVIRNPTTTVSQSLMGASIVVLFQHPGLGRVGFELSEELAKTFHQLVGKHVADLARSNSAERH